MILHLEIDQFIKEIESKINNLPIEQQNRAIDKIHLLTRIQLELRASNDKVRQVLIMNSESVLNELKLIKQLQVEKLNNELLKVQLEEMILLNKKFKEMLNEN